MFYISCIAVCQDLVVGRARRLLLLCISSSGFSFPLSSWTCTGLISCYYFRALTVYERLVWTVTYVFSQITIRILGLCRFNRGQKKYRRLSSPVAELDVLVEEDLLLPKFKPQSPSEKAVYILRSTQNVTSRLNSANSCNFQRILTVYKCNAT